jgi:hypothetical protein
MPGLYYKKPTNTMTTQPGQKRKRYSLFYRVYRRVRYIRYSRKIKKRKIRQFKKAEREELKEIRKKAQDQQKLEREQEQLKQSFEKKKIRTEQKSLKAEVIEARKAAAPAFRELDQKNRARKKEEKKYDRKRTRRLVRFVLKRKARNFKQFLLSLNLRNLKKSWIAFKKSKTRRRHFIIISVQATLIFVSSYIAIFLFSQLASSLAATFFDYSSIIHFNDIYFYVRTDEWFADSVKVVFAAGPISALFMGTFMLIIFSYIRYDQGLYKMLFLWAFLHGYTLFFGGILIGTLMGKGFGHVIAWSFIMDTGRMIYSLISISILVLIGFLVTRSFLVSANSYYSTLKTEDRRRFITAQFLIPYIFGNAILVLMRLPDPNMYFTFTSISFILVVIPVVATYSLYPSMFFDEQPIKIKYNWKLISGMVLTIVILRLLFGIGVPIG